jgi:hypothetical protein
VGITPRQVSVDNVRVLDKVYDGTRTALLSAIAAGITGLVAGQILSLQPGTLAFDTADVGRAKAGDRSLCAGRWAWRAGQQLPARRWWPGECKCRHHAKALT